MKRPNTPAPPPNLEKLKQVALRHPGVARAGFTTTEEGEWALKLWLRSGARAPLIDLEEQSAGSPIIYTEQPTDPPIARPAYPHLGE